MNKRERLLTFIEANPHQHVDEDIVELLWLGKSEEIGADVLIRAHRTVDRCRVCRVMMGAHHARHTSFAL